MNPEEEEEEEQLQRKLYERGPQTAVTGQSVSQLLGMDGPRAGPRASHGAA